MKIAPEHFQTLQSVLAQADKPEFRQQYLDGNFPNADKCRDLDKRYRHDLLYWCQYRAGLLPEYWLAETLYSYLNDDHIDTALRKLVPPLGVKTP